MNFLCFFCCATIKLTRLISFCAYVWVNGSTKITGDFVESASCDPGSVSRLGSDRGLKLACTIGSAPSPSNATLCEACTNFKSTLSRQSTMCDICIPGYFQNDVIMNGSTVASNATSLVFFACDPCPLGSSYKSYVLHVYSGLCFYHFSLLIYP